MASFNQQEIEFLQKHGNEVCHGTWLALWESTSSDIDSREEQKVKDHLVNKYERKTWYSDEKPNPPQSKPLTALLGNTAEVYVSTQKASSVNATIVTSQTSSAPKQQGTSHTDLLGIGNDPFAPTSCSSNNQSSFGAFEQPPPAQNQVSAFNAFPPPADAKSEDTFDLFANSRPSQQQAVNSSVPITNSTGQLGDSLVDKYAALADLDLNKTTQSVFSGSSVFGSSPATYASTQPNPFMSPGTSSSGAAVFQQQQQKPVNPFQSAAPTAVAPAQNNTNIFQQVLHNATDLSNNSPFYSWDGQNGNVNVPANSQVPSSTVPSRNSNFLFGTSSQNAGFHPQQPTSAPSQNMGFPPQQLAAAPLQNMGFPPQQPAAAPTQNMGFPPRQQTAAAPQNMGFPTQHPAAVPPQNMGFPPRQPTAAPPQNMGFPPQQPTAAAPQNMGFPPQQPAGAPSQNMGFPPQQQAMPLQNIGFPPQQQQQQASLQNAAFGVQQQQTLFASKQPFGDAQQTQYGSPNQARFASQQQTRLASQQQQAQPFEQSNFQTQPTFQANFGNQNSESMSQSLFTNQNQQPFGSTPPTQYNFATEPPQNPSSNVNQQMFSNLFNQVPQSNKAPNPHEAAQFDFSAHMAAAKQPVKSTNPFM